MEEDQILKTIESLRAKGATDEEIRVAEIYLRNQQQTTAQEEPIPENKVVFTNKYDKYEPRDPTWAPRVDPPSGFGDLARSAGKFGGYDLPAMVDNSLSMLMLTEAKTGASGPYTRDQRNKAGDDPKFMQFFESTRDMNINAYKDKTRAMSEYYPDIKQEKKNGYLKAAGEFHQSAIDSQEKGYERWGRDLITDTGDIKDFNTLGRWVAQGFGQQIPQIALSVATFGTTSFLMETATVYGEAIQIIAAEKSAELGREVTGAEVIEKEWDNKAMEMAIKWGIPAGALDAISVGGMKGALGVMSKTMRARMFKGYLKGTLREGSTEGVQTGFEQIGSEMGAGKNFEEAVDNMDPNEIRQATYVGMVTGGPGGLLGGIRDPHKVMQNKPGSEVGFPVSTENEADAKLNNDLNNFEKDMVESLEAETSGDYISLEDPTYNGETQGVDHIVRQEHNKNGGSLTDAEGYNLINSDGYMITPYEDSNQTIDGKTVTPEDIGAFRHANRQLLSDPRNFVKTWYDAATDKTLIGIARKEVDLSTAISFAKENGLGVIYDLKTMSAMQIADQEQSTQPKNQDKLDTTEQDATTQEDGTQTASLPVQSEPKSEETTPVEQPEDAPTDGTVTPVQEDKPKPSQEEETSSIEESKTEVKKNVAKTPPKEIKKDKPFSELSDYMRRKHAKNPDSPYNKEAVEYVDAVDNLKSSKKDLANSRKEEKQNKEQGFDEKTGEIIPKKKGTLQSGQKPFNELSEQRQRQIAKLPEHPQYKEAIALAQEKKESKKKKVERVLGGAQLTESVISDQDVEFENLSPAKKALYAQPRFEGYKHYDQALQEKELARERTAEKGKSRKALEKAATAKAKILYQQSRGKDANQGIIDTETENLNNAKKEYAGITKGKVKNFDKGGLMDKTAELKLEKIKAKEEKRSSAARINDDKTIADENTKQAEEDLEDAMAIGDISEINKAVETLEKANQKSQNLEANLKNEKVIVKYQNEAQKARLALTEEQSGPTQSQERILKAKKEVVAAELRLSLANNMKNPDVDKIEAFAKKSEADAIQRKKDAVKNLKKNKGKKKATETKSEEANDKDLEKKLTKKIFGKAFKGEKLSDGMKEDGTIDVTVDRELTSNLTGEEKTGFKKIGIYLSKGYAVTGIGKLTKMLKNSPRGAGLSNMIKMANKFFILAGRAPITILWINGDSISDTAQAGFTFIDGDPVLILPSDFNELTYAHEILHPYLIALNSLSAKAMGYARGMSINGVTEGETVLAKDIQKLLDATIKILSNLSPSSKLYKKINALSGSLLSTEKFPNGLSIPYGLTNIDEFFAEQSNPDFAGILDEIKQIDAGKATTILGKYVEAVNRFYQTIIDNVRKFLGLKPNQQSIYSDLKDVVKGAESISFSKEFLEDIDIVVNPGTVFNEEGNAIIQEKKNPKTAKDHVLDLANGYKGKATQKVFEKILKKVGSVMGKKLTQAEANEVWKKYNREYVDAQSFEMFTKISNMTILANNITKKNRNIRRAKFLDSDTIEYFARINRALGLSHAFTKEQVEAATEKWVEVMNDPKSTEEDILQAQAEVSEAEFIRKASNFMRESKQAQAHLYNDLLARKKDGKSLFKKAVEADLKEDRRRANNIFKYASRGDQNIVRYYRGNSIKKGQLVEHKGRVYEVLIDIGADFSKPPNPQQAKTIFKYKRQLKLDRRNSEEIGKTADTFAQMMTSEYGNLSHITSMMRNARDTDASFIDNVLGKTISDDLLNAEPKRFESFEKARNEIVEIKKRILRNLGKKDNIKGIRSLTNKGKNKITLDENNEDHSEIIKINNALGSGKVSNNELAFMYAQSRSERNEAAFEFNGVEDVELLQAQLKKVLPDGFAEYVDAIMNEFLPKYGKRLDGSFKDAFGVSFEFIDNYFPLTRVLDTESNSDKIAESLLTKNNPLANLWLGHLKEVNSNPTSLPKVEDIDEALMRYVNQMEDFMAFYKPLKRATKLLTDPTVKAIAIDKVGYRSYKSMLRALERYAQSSTDPLHTNWIVERMDNALTFSALALKFSQVPKQSVSAIQYSQDMPSGTTFSGTLLEMISKGVYSSTIKELMETSSYRLRRSKGVSIEMAEALTRQTGFINTKGAKLEKAAMFAITAGDMLAVLGGGSVLYYAYKKKFGIEKAEQAWNKSTGLRQQSSLISNKSLINDTSIKKAMYKFLSNPIQNMQNYSRNSKTIRDSIMERGLVGGLKTKSAKGAMKSLLITNMLFPALWSGIPIVPQFFDDDADETALIAEWIAATIGSTLSGIPILGAAMTWSLDLFMKDNPYKMRTLPSFEELGEIAKGADVIVKAFNSESEEITEAEIRATIKGINFAWNASPWSAATGKLPISNLYEIYYKLGIKDQSFEQWLLGSPLKSGKNKSKFNR